MAGRRSLVTMAGSISRLPMSAGTDEVQTALPRTTDALLDELIDKDTFNSRKQSLELERLRLEEALEKQAARQPEPDRVRQFLELTKSLKTLFISAIAAERRELVRWATSNCLVEMKNVCVEPANWLVVVEDAVRVFGGDPHRPTPRSSPDERVAHIEAIMRAAATHGDQLSKLSQ
ncbi:MAG: hypothetical protein KDJ80_08150 [Nitratireductor sp.]|nr:hypothetical protein [Nitratireductor sp.]